jgi:hypothetical protein
MSSTISEGEAVGASCARRGVEERELKPETWTSWVPMGQGRDPLLSTRQILLNSPPAGTTDPSTRVIWR